MSLHIDWPSFPTFVWNFSSLCLLLQYLSCPIWILILGVSPQCQALSHYLEEVHRTGPRLLQHNHQTLFYCCNSHLQMGTYRTPSQFQLLFSGCPTGLSSEKLWAMVQFCQSQGCQKPSCLLSTSSHTDAETTLVSGLSSPTWILLSRFVGIICHVVLQNRVCGYPSYSVFLCGDSKLYCCHHFP